VNGVYEKDPVTGQDVLPGNPILAHDGTFDTPEEVMCYECVVDMDNETAECRATDGVQGTSPDDTCGGACNYGYDCEEGDLVWKQDGPYGSELTSCDYVCDGGGEKMLVEPGESYPETSSWDALQCYSCDPSVSTPLPADAGTVGYIGANEVCTYTCENGEKVFDTSGRTTEELKCYQCTGGTTSEPVDGVDGYLEAGEECTYGCVEGNKVYVEGIGGVRDYNSFGCYECTGGHEYTQVQGGGKGYASGGFDNDGGKCWYWCNDESSPEVIVRDVRDAMEDPSLVSKPTLDEVACWTCDGDPGPGSGCAQVTQGVGQFSSAETCDTDSGAQCGWGYGCENDSCAITSSAARGRSEEECKFDSTEKCGWAYGCFNKFACVDGVSCAPIPEEECTVDGGADGKFVCHDSADECVANSTCAIASTDCPNPLGGDWFIHRSTSTISMVTGELDSPDALKFAKGDVDSDGFTWYVSDLLFPANNLPVLEMGVRDSINGTRSVEVKFRGSFLGTGPDFYWSKTAANQGSYESPTPIVVASNLPLDECFEFDSVDLGKICGETRCAEPLVSIILQRAELCGVNNWGNYYGDLENNGALDVNKCDVFYCADDPMTTQSWAVSRFGYDVGVKAPNQLLHEFTYSGYLDGYHWYTSNLTSTDGTTVSEVGFANVIENDVRNVYAKYRGLTQWTATDINAVYHETWSTSTLHGSDGSYENPEPFIISSVPVSECYSPLEFKIPYMLVVAGVDKTGWMTFYTSADLSPPPGDE
jgi:hypothetical protein